MTPRSLLPVLLSATMILASGPAPAVASPTPVTGTLLPVPAGQSTVTAADAAPLGVVGGTASVQVANPDGTGQGTNSRPVLWVGGATLRLPVISSFFLGPACVSRVQADGSIVSSGYSVDGGGVALVMVRHVGGVPGTDVELSRATGAGQPVAGLACGAQYGSDTLTADGGIAGYVTDAGGTRAAYWNGGNERTVVSLAAGERSARGVAVADGGRMVIQAEGDDGGVRLSLWHNGDRTPLATPEGWTVGTVVELTDHGLLVANVRNAAGTVRPAVWQL